MSINYGYQPIVTNGLVLHLDAANPNSYISGSTAWNDLSGNRNNGTLINGPGYSSANFGSITFDGVNDYITGQNTNLSNTSATTVSFFCKLNAYNEITGSGNVLFETTTNFNASSTGVVVSYADDSNAAFLRTFPIAISLSGNIGYNISAFDKTLVNDLRWHYWTCIFDKTQTGTNPQETFLYVDGVYRTPTIVPSATYRQNNTNSFGNDPYFIAARSGSIAPSNAQVSNLQIYNRALTAAEVQQNFNALKSRYNL